MTCPGGTGEARKTNERPPFAAPVRQLARQPILDVCSRVVAYELLSREGLATAFTGDGQEATRTMIDNAVVYGLSKLTGGLPAFINCTAETLTSEHVELLPRELAVLEVLEDIDPTPEIVRACARLHHLGYRIALDDFILRPGIEPLVELADMIKIDFRQTTRNPWRRPLSR